MKPYRRTKATSISKNAPVVDALAVVIMGEYAGELRHHGNNYMSFHYDPGYSGPDFSYSMLKEHGLDHYDLAVRPVIEGLLPDNETTRSVMAEEAGTGSGDIFGMLAKFGKECPGAVQICSYSELDSVLMAEGDYIPVLDREIHDRLIEAANQTRPQWHHGDESWSLGGNQGKFTLALINGKWHQCLGAYPSTHIIKPGVAGMDKQALVEFVTMQIAERVGLHVARTTFERFDGLDAIVIERYDRSVDGSGVIQRVHQEDLCQALGVLPDKKYLPTTQDCIQVIESAASHVSVTRFTNALFFNYLVGGIDAHAKNYSLIYPGRGDAALAPLYDLASVLPYEKITKDKWYKTPMSIGGQTKIGALTGSDIKKHAAKYRLDPDGCLRNMQQMTERIPKAIESVWQEYAHVPGIEPVMAELSRTVGQNCKAMQSNLDRSHEPNSFVKPNLKTINSGSLIRTSQARFASSAFPGEAEAKGAATILEPKPKPNKAAPAPKPKAAAIPASDARDARAEAKARIHPASKKGRTKHQPSVNQ